MFTIILYCAAVSGLGVSLFKSRDKTRLVLKKAWKSFENILPQFLTVLLIIGILLSVFNKDMTLTTEIMPNRFFSIFKVCRRIR